MLKLVGFENDMLRVLDLNDWTIESVSVEDMVDTLQSGVEVDGCDLCLKGLYIYGATIEPFYILHEFWRKMESPDFVLDKFSPRYEISNFGRIRLWKRINKSAELYDIQILDYSYGGKGYPIIDVEVNSEEHLICRVDYAVATTFVDNPNKYAYISMLNGDKSDLCAWNIEWVERAGLSVDSANFGYRIRQYTKDLEFVAEYTKLIDAARAIHMSSASVICKCCRRVPGHYSCGGYIWRYATDDEFAIEDEPCVTSEPAVPVNALFVRPVDEFAGEVWKPVTVNNKMFNTVHWLYEVSNFGRVRQYLGYGRYRFRKQYVSSGAIYIRLATDTVCTALLAKVVAEAFVDNPNNFEFVSFLDENGTNCCADNLKWVETEDEVKKNPVHESAEDKELAKWRDVNFDIFKADDGFPLYQVRDTGVIRQSTKGSYPRITRINGVVKVALKSRGGNTYYVSVGGLVATLFLGRPDAAKGLIYQDGNRENCSVDNLRWCKDISKADEVVDDLEAFFAGLVEQDANKGADAKSAEQGQRIIRQFTLDGRIVAEYDSAKEVQQKLGYKVGKIKKACSGPVHTAYDSMWQYAWRTPHK